MDSGNFRVMITYGLIGTIDTNVSDKNIVSIFRTENRNEKRAIFKCIRMCVIYVRINKQNICCIKQAKVSMKSEVLGVWVRVPCIKDFGSCTYEDLCIYGYDEDTTCPESFVQDHVPCRCPIKKVCNFA